MALLRSAVALHQYKRDWLSTGTAGEGVAVPYRLVVRMDIPADKDQLFNDVYNEHCQVRLVPGVLGIRRYKTSKPLRPVIGLRRQPEISVRLWILNLFKRLCIQLHPFRDRRQDQSD